MGISAARASGPVGVRHSHFLDWMYQLPVAEAPGWTSPVWMDVQASESNVWNRPMQVLDRDTGRVFEYEADYQASIVVLDAGIQVLEDLAFSVELPYLRRHSGSSDQFIEDWHQTFGFYNYLRSGTPDNRARVRVAVDGQETFEDNSPADGLSSVKLKLKYRVLGSDSSCPCGLAFSVQANLPVNGSRRALSSGSESYSWLAHAGIPVGSESGLYFTSGFSLLGDNPVFGDWPLHKAVAMADFSMDLGVGGGWGFLASFTGYSPWMKSRFDFLPDVTDRHPVRDQRIASGYNSLFRWRGYQNYGFRYRWGPVGSQFSLFIFEDFGFGDYDGRKDITYNNNSPDVLIGTQLSLRF
ncbi:MAG: DUF3187 family protein [Bdellovibrionaceae bacterium]|nr:DUF3187 family protein [Pseudobdellovibrionaceae bacterium]